MVYEFLEGGGLLNLLNSEEGAKAFDWIKRVNIIKGVANVLSYICRDDRGTLGLWGTMAPPNLKKKNTSIYIGTSFSNFVL